MSEQHNPTKGAAPDVDDARWQGRLVAYVAGAGLALSAIALIVALVGPSGTQSTVDPYTEQITTQQTGHRVLAALYLGQFIVISAMVLAGIVYRRSTSPRPRVETGRLRQLQGLWVQNTFEVIGGGVVVSLTPLPGVPVIVTAVVMIAYVRWGYDLAAVRARRRVPYPFPWGVVVGFVVVQLLVWLVVGVMFLTARAAALFLAVPAWLADFALSWVVAGTIARWFGWRFLPKRMPARSQRMTANRRRAVELLNRDTARFMQRQCAAAGYGIYLGMGPDCWRFSEPEHAVLVLGPPRSGKTSSIVLPTIVSFPGPLLTTSTKLDVLDQTAHVRQALGRCWLFDPTGTVPVPPGVEQLRWSPLLGCRDWDRARARARAMSGAASATGSPAAGVTNESFWTERAETLLAPLLHAAVVAGRDMATVMEWVNRRDLNAALFILNGADEPVMSVLGEVAEAEDKQLGSTWRSIGRHKNEVSDHGIAIAADWGGALWEAARLLGTPEPAEGWTDDTTEADLATSVLALLLHAAGRDGQPPQAVTHWLAQRDLSEVQALLNGRGRSPQAGNSLSGMSATDSREISGVWSTAASVVSTYQSDAALVTTSGTLFDVDAFVRGGPGKTDTIYVAANSEQQRLIAPVVVGLVDEIRRATYQAFAERGTPYHQARRPPVLLALDEARNIAPIKELPSLVSEAGGQGLIVMACFQDLSQAEERWGPAAKGFMSLFSTNVVLRGIKERDTLELISCLFGEHEVEVRTHSEPSMSFVQWLDYLVPGAPPIPPGQTSVTTRKERQVPLRNSQDLWIGSFR